VRRFRSFTPDRLPIWSLVLTLFLLAGCGGDDSSGEPTSTATGSPTEALADADTYATNMCTAITDWATSIQERNTTLQEELQGETSVEGVKQRVLGFLDDAIASTDQMLEQVDEVGVPDVENGEEVHQQLAGALQSSRDVLADARDTVDQLDSDDPQAMSQGLEELGASIQSAFADISSPLESLENEELDEAFSENAACTELMQLGS
jgi:hypothetical protein